MIASIGRSIGAKILLLAALNLLLLIAIGLAASGVRVPRSISQMVMQSAERRLQDAVRRIALDLERSSAGDASAVLQRYAGEFRTRFILVLNDGTRLAGADLALPADVVRALSGPRSPDGRGPRDGFRPPPKAGGFPPPGSGRFRDGPPDRVGPPESGSGLRLPQTPAHLVTVDGDPAHWIVLRTPIRFAGQSDIVPGSLLVVPYGWLGDSLLFPVQWIGWALLALVVTGVCWFPFLRGITTSLGRMERVTDQIAHGTFDARLSLSRTDELGRLSSSIESMATRLGALVSGQKRFLGDTAHELRSPLGRMQVALEILRNRVNDAERRYVDDLKEDVDALTALTDELLQYAKAELTERGSARQSVALRPIVDRVVAREGTGATITVDVPGDLVVRGDAQLLERAIANVVRNAVKYAGTAGPIVIDAESGDGTVTFKVADSGPGVAPESIGRIFEPFFREDRARNRRTGGVGLGLAIVRSAIEACGGTVGCANLSPNGLQVTILLKSQVTQ